MKKTLVIMGILLGLSSLNGCALIQSHKPVMTFTASSTSLDKLADGIYSLIHTIRTADEGTISLQNVSREITVQRIEKEVSAKLKANGYAVQEILPKDSRQEGDVKVVKPTGTLMMINLQPLSETSFYQLTVDFGEESYYRMITLQNRTFTPVSQWARKKLYEPYLE